MLRLRTDNSDKHLVYICAGLYLLFYLYCGDLLAPPSGGAAAPGARSGCIEFNRHVRFFHAVNSWQMLEEALDAIEKDGGSLGRGSEVKRGAESGATAVYYYLLETDVMAREGSVGFGGAPRQPPPLQRRDIIHCHPPCSLSVQEKAPTFFEYMERLLAFLSRHPSLYVGVKLDFKDEAALPSVLVTLLETGMFLALATHNARAGGAAAAAAADGLAAPQFFPLWLNADVLKGPAGLNATVDGVSFVEKCVRFLDMVVARQRGDGLAAVGDGAASEAAAGGHLFTHHSHVGITLSLGFTAGYDRRRRRFYSAAMAERLAATIGEGWRCVATVAEESAGAAALVNKLEELRKRVTVTVPLASHFIRRKLPLAWFSLGKENEEGLTTMLKYNWTITIWNGLYDSEHALRSFFAFHQRRFAAALGRSVANGRDGGAAVPEDEFCRSILYDIQEDVFEYDPDDDPR